MSTTIKQSFEVSVSLLGGNIDVSRDSGKITWTCSSVESVTHAAAKLESLALRMANEARQIQGLTPLQWVQGR